MLSLLSRIVSGGGDSDHHTKKKMIEYTKAPELSSSVSLDTDEELFGHQMPVININQTEVAQEVFDNEMFSFQTDAETEPTDSCEDIKDDSALEIKMEEQVPFLIPSRASCHRIVELIEYYLSDENLVKDMFLLKHVSKHREGYVSVKLLTSYKKVKRLTKDWRVVAYSLKSSTSLELNNDETKVRRQAPLPQMLEEDTRPFRIVLATHLSQDKANMNQLAEFFGKFGEMISLQLHKPGGRTLHEVQQAEQQHPGLIKTVCAIVEYEKVYSARHALRFINNNAEESKMKAMEIPRKKQTATLSVKKKADAESAYYSNSDLSEPTSSTFNNNPIIRKLKTSSSNYPIIRKLKTSSSSIASTPNISPIIRRCRGQVNQSSPESSPPSPYSSQHGGPSPCSSPEGHDVPRPLSSCNQYFFQQYEVPEVPGSLPLPRRRLPNQIPHKGKISKPQNNNLEKPLLPLSPWLRRRAVAKDYDTDSLNSSSPSSPSLRRRTDSSLSSPSLRRQTDSLLSSPSLRRRTDSTMLLPDNVTRFPRGPDGSKGFATCHRSSLVQAKA